MREALPVAEAQGLVLEAAPLLGTETLALATALGRVLAEPVESTRTLPPADCSAMDGYAVRAGDVAGARADRPVALPVVAEVPAGGASTRPLAAGEAMRIFTGAPVPEGADAVVRQEDTAREGDGPVRVQVAVPVGEHVRPAGEDVRAGERVLEPGVVLGPARIGLLSSLGRTVVSVRQRPRVAILSGGDELVEPDGDASGGRIVSSNSWSLAAQCREAGAEPVYLGIARDTPEDLERTLVSGLRSDVVVSSAGVSVGDHDHVRPVLEKLGCTLVFWGVLMKPGYPLVFGRFGESGPLVFGLPGNPVSAMVTFEQFVRPVLRKMAGHRAVFRPTLRATLTHALDKRAGRLHFVRVQLDRGADGVLATSTGSQSSGVLRSMTLGQGLLIFPAEATRLEAGAEVTVQVFDEGFFAETHSGV